MLSHLLEIFIKGAIHIMVELEINIFIIGSSTQTTKKKIKENRITPNSLQGIIQYQNQTEALRGLGV